MVVCPQGGQFVPEVGGARGVCTPAPDQQQSGDAVSNDQMAGDQGTECAHTTGDQDGAFRARSGAHLEDEFADVVSTLHVTEGVHGPFDGVPGDRCSGSFRRFQERQDRRETTPDAFGVLERKNERKVADTTVVDSHALGIAKFVASQLHEASRGRHQPQ